MTPDELRKLADGLMAAGAPGWGFEVEAEALRQAADEISHLQNLHAIAVKAAEFQGAEVLKLRAEIAQLRQDWSGKVPKTLMASVAQENALLRDVAEAASYLVFQNRSWSGVDRLHDKVSALHAFQAKRDVKICPFCLEPDDGTRLHEPIEYARSSAMFVDYGKDCPVCTGQAKRDEKWAP